jgi:hypothetical protein
LPFGRSHGEISRLAALARNDNLDFAPETEALLVRQTFCLKAIPGRTTMPDAPGDVGAPRGNGTTYLMRETETIERDGRRWCIRPAAAAPLLADGWPIDRPDRLTVVKRGHRRTVCRCEAGGEAFFV